jgi:hypothetical protein
MKAALPWLSLVAGCAGAAPEPVLVPEPADVETTVLLIGDGGNPDPAGEPVLQALRAVLEAAPGQRVVVFLGDNIYPRGLPDSSSLDRAEMERRIDAQLDAALLPGVRGIVVAGNHDWAGQGADGWNAVRRQAAHIARRSGGRAALLPAEGCPGPTVVDVGRRLRIVALDTQWWLHGGPKPDGQRSGCRAATREAVQDSLRADLARAGERQVLLVAHHPLASGGQHGGFFGWEDQLFPLHNIRPWLLLPLPGFGTIYALARQWGISSQDLAGAENRRMRQALAGAMAQHPPLIWANGHEHSLQVLQGRGEGPRHLLVSGGGFAGHESPVTALVETRFSTRAPGFMRLAVTTAGRVRLGVLALDRQGQAHERFSMWLK